MRVMLKVSVPAQQGNKAIKEGKLPKLITGFVERVKPEASYFLTEGGNRTFLFFLDMKETSDMPPIAEPFFMELDAGVEWCPAMNLEDVRAGIQKAMKAG